MSSNRTEPRSIASQLVLLFTFAATLLLSCGLGVFYLLVIRHAFEEDNAVLADKISAIIADLKTGEGPNILREELKAPRAGEHAAYWVRVLSAEGPHLGGDAGNGACVAREYFSAHVRIDITSWKSPRLSPQREIVFIGIG